MKNMMMKKKSVSSLIDSSLMNLPLQHEFRSWCDPIESEEDCLARTYGSQETHNTVVEFAEQLALRLAMHREWVQKVVHIHVHAVHLPGHKVSWLDERVVLLEYCFQCRNKLAYPHPSFKIAFTFFFLNFISVDWESCL